MGQPAQKQQQPQSEPEGGIKFKFVNIVGPSSRMMSHGTISSEFATFEVLEFAMLRVVFFKGQHKGTKFILPPGRWEAEEF